MSNYSIKRTLMGFWKAKNDLLEHTKTEETTKTHYYNQAKTLQRQSHGSVTEVRAKTIQRFYPSLLIEKASLTSLHLRIMHLLKNHQNSKEIKFRTT